MKVNLAGFNVDTTVLKELQEKAGNRDDITPEVLSASYARISRDPRPIDEIRKDARLEVEKARKSNSTIIFKMGHHSVAEHAVFNLDISEVSRLAMEELEKFRLCSYTEKSQRYITLDKAFVVPPEIIGTKFEKDFLEVVNKQNNSYSLYFEKLKDYVFKKYKELAKDPKNYSILEGWAKEDARYITSLSIQSQVGLTLNARNLELLLRRFASHPLLEINNLGRAIYKEIAEIAPSIVIFHQANERDKLTYPKIKEVVNEFVKKKIKKASLNKNKKVELVEYTSCADKIIATALFHTVSNLSYKECKEIVEKLTLEELKEIFKASWRYMQFYDSMLREYEYVELVFNLIISAACFAQLKRHRMTTITTQSYEPKLGITIPRSIKEIGMEKHFKKIVSDTNRVYFEIKKELPHVAPYILTNAHRRRVLIRVNARELYHISRLREDMHAQWDIRNLVKEMTKEAKKVMPLTFGLIGGKDKYNKIYKSIFGELPKITKIELPGVRKIRE